MKRLLILSLVVALTACSSLGNRSSQSDAERAAQEAAQQEAARQEAARQEAQRQEAQRQEAQRQEAARQEAARQEAARQEAARQEAARQEAQRQEAAQLEEARIAEEQQRMEEEARIEEERRQAEARRQEELRQIEELRRQRMEDDDDTSLVGMVTEEQLRKANPLLLEQSIFFDFDRYQIKSEYAPVIAAHARFLIAHPTVKIFVEGNCDDRGSPEYNIALGQRRADAVQRALLTLGVPRRQIEAVSYGAERPLAYGANEESWARNRRADIAYPMFKN